MFSILVVEDSQITGTIYSSFLAKQGFDVTTASSMGETLAEIESRHIDLLLCDTGTKTIDGPTLVESIRSSDDNVSIIILSDSSDFRTKQRAFTAGVDDFMVKPVDLNELLLRIGALMRRAHAASKQRIVIGNAVLDSTSMTVIDGSESTILPPKEFMMLFKLCTSPGRIFTRREIMDDVWGIRVKSNERTVDVHIKRLREKFQRSRSFRIETVRGVGYRAVERK